ncbi:hypothetical protein H4219_004976 [Mycoemilia scoparia]|uniref:Xylanolytic transcriptional activator regulatory domain-containing protein n=1 Tax=Mycoemilia scoparia TaxID=417184 RepID=A0A9W8DQF8_9FUNG|nr:hypothetical protein H4219_004975 [Mycoemilia scoparia]KAJ1913991.1 hypothetical protein H4219_004976 [Mycoemilia scoparia]
MACIALLSTHSIEIKNKGNSDLHRQFYRRSLSYVESAIEDVCLDNIVGLLWLAMYEGCIGRIPQMQYHTSLALRAVRSIIFRGTSYPWKGFGEEEYDFQHETLIRTFWCAYMWDSLAATVMGDLTPRMYPSEFPRFPDQDELFYGAEIEVVKHSKENYETRWKIPTHLPNSSYYTLRLAKLILIQGCVNDMLVKYFHDHQIPSISEILALDNRLVEWYSDLPSQLILDYNNLDEVPQLHNTPMIDEITMMHLIWLYTRILLHKIAMAVILNRDPGAVYRVDGPFQIRDSLPKSSQLLLHPSELRLSRDIPCLAFDEKFLEFSRHLCYYSAFEIHRLATCSHQKAGGTYGYSIWAAFAIAESASVYIDLAYSPDTSISWSAMMHILELLQYFRRTSWRKFQHIFLNLIIQGILDPDLRLQGPPPTTNSPKSQNNSNFESLSSNTLSGNGSNNNGAGDQRHHRPANSESNDQLGISKSNVGGGDSMLVDTDDGPATGAQGNGGGDGNSEANEGRGMEPLSYIKSNRSMAARLATITNGSTMTINNLEIPSTLSPMALDSRNPFPPNHILSIIMGWLGLDPESFFAPTFPVLHPEDISPDTGRWYMLEEMVHEYWQNPEKHNTIWDEDDLLRFVPAHWWQGFKPKSRGPALF